jgi:hypothetical protein
MYIYIYRFMLYSSFIFSHTNQHIYEDIYIHTHTHTHIYIHMIYAFTHTNMYIYTHTHVLCDLLLIYIYIVHACLDVCVYIYALHFKALLRHLALVFRGLSGLKHFIVVRLYYGTWHWCLKGLLD